MDSTIVYLLCFVCSVFGLFVGIMLSASNKKEDVALSTIQPSLVPEPRSTSIQYVEDVKIIDLGTWHTEVSNKLSMKNIKVTSYPSDMKLVNNGKSITVWTRWETK